MECGRPLPLSRQRLLRSHAPRPPFAQTKRQGAGVLPRPACMDCGSPLPLSRQRPLRSHAPKPPIAQAKRQGAGALHRPACMDCGRPLPLSRRRPLRSHAPKPPIAQAKRKRAGALPRPACPFAIRDWTKGLGGGSWRHPSPRENPSSVPGHNHRRCRGVRSWTWGVGPGRRPNPRRHGRCRRGFAAPFHEHRYDCPC